MTPTRKVSFGLLALDVVAVGVAFNVVSAIWLYRVGISSSSIVLPLLGPLAVLMIALYLIDGYNARTDMMSLGYTSLHVIALASAAVATLLMTFVVIPRGYELQSSRAVIALSFIVLAPVTLGYRRLIHRRAAARRGVRSLVFIGDDASGREFQEECRRTGTVQPIVYAIAGAPARPGPAASPWPSRPFDDVLDEIEAGRLPVEAIVLRESARTNQYWLDNVLSRAQERPEMLDWCRSRYADNEAITAAELTALAKEYLSAARASRVIVIPTAPDNASPSGPTPPTAPAGN